MAKAPTQIASRKSRPVRLVVIEVVVVCPSAATATAAIRGGIG